MRNFRCTPYEWEGTHPCDSDPQELENTWNLKNCLWLALGTVLQQGCDILPKYVVLICERSNFHVPLFMI